MSSQGASEAGQERFIQHAGAEGIVLIRVKNRRPRENIVPGRKLLVQPRIILIRIDTLRLDR